MSKNSSSFNRFILTSATCICSYYNCNDDINNNMNTVIRITVGTERPLHNKQSKMNDFVQYEVLKLHLHNGYVINGNDECFLYSYLCKHTNMVNNADIYVTKSRGIVKK